jgi:hypothetical protein
MIKCPNCGAQLHGEASAVHVCEFCGAETRELVAPAPAPATRASAEDDAPKVPAPFPVSALVFGLVILLGGGFGIAMCAGSRDSSGRAAQGSTTAGASTAKPKLTLAALATTPFSYEPIDAPGMIGTFQSFDLMANYEWAAAIGRAWKQDAVLYQMGVDKVAKDGTIDVKNVPKAEALYRFYSPACTEARKASTSVVAPTTKCGLFVQILVERGGPTALVNNVSADSQSDPPLPSPACTLSKAFAALEKAGKLPAKPVFNADVFVYKSSSTGKLDSNWSIADIQGQSIGKVDATSCAIR